MQFAVLETASRASSGSMVVDPTPLRTALAALPGHNFLVGACGLGQGQPAAGARRLQIGAGLGRAGGHLLQPLRTLALSQPV